MAFTNAGVERGFSNALGLLGSSVWLASHTAQPTTGNEINLTRQEITNSEWNFSNNMATLNARQTFPTPTGDLGTPTHVGLWSAVSSGTLLAWAALTNSVDPISSGLSVYADTGGIVVSVPNTAVFTNDGAGAFLNGGLLDVSRYLALHSASATSGNEVDVDREEITSGAWGYSNNVAMVGTGQEFASPGSTIATISHWALWSAADSGNILVRGSLASTLTNVLSVGTLSFANSVFSITVPLS